MAPFKLYNFCLKHFFLTLSNIEIFGLTKIKWDTLYMHIVLSICRFFFSILRRHGDFIDVEHTVLNGRIIKNKSATEIIDELDDID